MARFLDNAASIRKEAGRKKKKQETPQPKQTTQSPSVSQNAQNVNNRLTQKYGGGTSRGTSGSSGNQTQTQRRNQNQNTYGQNERPMRRNQAELQRQAAERRNRDTFQTDRSRVSQSRNARMLDTARGTKPESITEYRARQEAARRQKSGENNRVSRSAQRAANRAMRNTPGVAKESARQALIGHGKTAADLTAATNSSSLGSRAEFKSRQFQEDIERRRGASTRTAQETYRNLSRKQEKSEERMQNLTKNAKGLEKAYYGALESGIGMATDALVGAATGTGQLGSLTAMASRTYGTSRGQAQKEGATENEDRLYSLAQGLKESGTELMFPGAGAAKRVYGRAGLSLAEKGANLLTRRLRGKTADIASAGLRLAGGVTEENLEELAGWGLDPLIKEFTYGRRTRERDAKEVMERISGDLRSNIKSDADAQSAAAYLSSPDFLEETKQSYIQEGMSESEAADVARKMRDYLAAGLSGDTETMMALEDEVSKQIAKGKKLEWDRQELRDTIASTTLLTGVTGLPGTITTTAKGAGIRDALGDEGVRALANTAIDFEDAELSYKGQAARDRIDSGNSLTATQVYDLAEGQAKQYAVDRERVIASRAMADKAFRNNDLVAPFTEDQNGNVTDIGEVTGHAYNAAADSAVRAIRNVSEENGKESLTDRELDRGRRAIAGFKTGVFTIDDANELNFSNGVVREAFKTETGIDLDQYIVRDKKGNVNIPATNTATKNALFAMAADNLVQSAEAETVNWMDTAKGETVKQVTARMGAKGSLALQQALDDVDERDRSTYMMTANAADMLYQTGRNMGTAWDLIKEDAKRVFPNIPEEKLKTMYEAGLDDRLMAMDDARGQQIQIGEKIKLEKNNQAPMGQVLVETEAPVKGTVLRTFSELADNLGVDIHLVDDLSTGTGNQANGQYIDGNIYINVNSDFEQNMGYIFMHEVTHHLKIFAPEQYKELENLVREKWFDADPSQMQSEIAKKIDLYARNGQKLTEEQALEEIIADAAHEFINDPNFAKTVADENPTLARAILNGIRNALRMLRRVLATGSIEDETHMNSLFSQLDILDEAERLWLNAYTQAVKNKAAVGIEDLQERIYEEGRQSVTEDEEVRQTAENILETINNAPKWIRYYGIRKDYRQLNVGDDLGNSQNMLDDLYDEETDTYPELDGISATNIPIIYGDENDVDAIIQAIETNAEYPGDYQYLVGGTDSSYGDDSGETIIQNAEVLSVIKSPSDTKYSISEMPSIDDLDQTNSTVEDENGDMVAQFQENGSVMFSISSFENSGREIYTDYLNKQVKNGNLSRKEADDMLHELETVYGIAKDFADSGKYAPYTAWSYADVVTGENGKPVFSAIKKNSEYKMNIDFSTICKKRRTLDAVFREMINRGMFEKLDLNKDESAAMVVNINNLIRQHKFEAACALCFVEARRYRQQQTAKTFTDMWNKLIESMYTGNNKAAYFNFGEDSTAEDVQNPIHELDDTDLDLTYLKKLANEKDDKGKKKQTAEAKAARLILSDPSQRKLMRVGDMMASTGFENMQIKNPELMKVYNSKKGTGGAKSSFGDVQYLNEILKPRTFGRMAAYAVSGVRIQSFSDYVPRMVFDYVQVIADLAAKKLPAHGYTKEPLFAYQFGLTGAKINLSLVPDVAADSEIPGLDKDGNYLWNEEGTFPYDVAMELQKAEGYKENCGTIAVGISDEQIMKMLADPTIQMVIPYHKSSLNPIVAAMTNVDRFTNYEPFQTTKDENGNAVSKDFDWDKKLFRLSHDSKGKMLPKEEWGNVQELVKEYAEWCKSKNYTPKFEKFLYLDEEKTQINPGYYKLLEDFALLDNDGNFKPQGDVQMRFPTESDAFGSMKDLIAQGLSEDTELEAKRSSEISGIVDEIDEMFKQGTLTEQSATSEKLAARMSISENLDQPYMDAVNSGNMEEAQRLVDEAAKASGLNSPLLYHGTYEQFTTFKGNEFLSEINGLPQIKGYFSEDRDVSEVYGDVSRYYVGINNPLDFYDVPWSRTETEWRKWFESKGIAGIKFDSSIYEDTLKEHINDRGENEYSVFEIFDGADMWAGDGNLTERIAAAGYDGMRWDYDEKAWIPFDDTAIKSADTITYAEDGSVIPLSERFDPSNNDIRYSLPTQDSDGNILSDGQMEFFKNSQARDAEGRLQVVYHSTDEGGFTIFDPSYSKDNRSLFFTSSLKMSKSYFNRESLWRGEEGQMINPYDMPDETVKGTYSEYVNLTNPLVIDGMGHNWDDIPYNGNPTTIRNPSLYLEPDWSETEDGDPLISGYSLMISWEQLDESEEWAETSVETYLENPNPEDTEWYPAEEAENFAESNGISKSFYKKMLSEAEEEPMDGSVSYESEDEEEEITLYDTAYTTRELAEIAQNEGYDGAIIKSITDYGGLGYGNEPADVYIAFSSNQVKDTRNTDPTNNPDIRYSIPDEDETIEYLTETADNMDDMFFTDPALEEGRRRLGRAKADFIFSKSNKWNERWLTKGLVLDERKTKRAVREAVMNVMSKAEGEAKYKSELVDEAMKTCKKAFYLMKIGKFSEAGEIIYDLSRNMVENNNFFNDAYEETFNNYVELRNYIKARKFYVPDLGAQEYAEHRRNDMGKIWLCSERKGTPIDKEWLDLCKNFPEWFSIDEAKPSEMLFAMENALSAAEPVAKAYCSEEAVDYIDTLANQLYDIVYEGEEYKSIADVYKASAEQKTAAMKQRFVEAMRSLQTAKEEHRAEIKELKARNKQNLRTQKMRYEFEIAELKQNREYNIQRLKAEKARAIKEERQKNRERQQEKRTAAQHREMLGRITDKYNTLCKWVLDPTKEKNVPEEFRVALAEFLQTLDLQTYNSKALEEKTGHVAYKTFKMRELKDRLNALAESKTDVDGNYSPGIFEVDAYVGYLMDSLSNKLDGKPVDALDNEAISDIDTIMKAIIRNIQRYKEVKLEAKNAELSDIGGRAADFFIKKRERDGLYGKHKGPLGALETINTTALTPAYLFDRMGPFKEMYDVLRHNGFDTYIRNEKMITDKLKEILSPYYNVNNGKRKRKKPVPGSEVEKWRDDRSAQTIELSDGNTVTMTAAQIMSLYCLNKRGEQAQGHMLVGGILVTPIQTGSKIEAAKERIKRKADVTEKRVLSHEDIENIISKLTPEQMHVADQLQELMSVDMAELGNEAHRELYGYDMFNESNYFPIKVHGNERATNINTIGEVFEKIKSFGFTKPLTPQASKAIEIDDIFSVVADHCNGMNLYNAYLVPITDFMKVLNYTHTAENGEVITMKEAIEQTYGKDVLKYILNMMKDINGIRADNRGGLEGIMNGALGTAKKTAVFGNIRVALQQPTAIVRAWTEVNPKYFMPLTDVKLNDMSVYEEMYKYCPIAQWKNWGYYDTYMGRDIEDVMMNKFSASDVALSGIYGLLDNMTWSAIWQAVKSEQMDAHPEMDYESDEFLKLCGRRASEVFDKTQVVDSTFHRSDAMRSKQVAVKAFTAFMSEPTLTLNVFRAGLYNAGEEMKAGNKGKATAIMSRTLGVIAAQAVIVSLAQAVADAWRGKDPGLPWEDDDDDDEEKADYMARLMHNWINNIFEQVHLENNMYLVKDVTPYINYMISKGAEYWNWDPTLRAVMGWDQDYLYSQNNLIFAGLENTANGIAQVFKKLQKGDDYDKTWYDVVQKAMSGIGTFTGIPIGTLMRDFHPIWDKFFASSFAMDELVEPKVGKLLDSDSGSASSGTTESTQTSTTAETTSAGGGSETYSKEKPFFGLGKSEYEKHQEELEKERQAEEKKRNDKIDSIKEKTADVEGLEKDKKVWSSVTKYMKDEEHNGKSLTEYIHEGDFNTIDEVKTMYMQAGGSVDYFNERMMYNCKKEMKKTISSDNTEDQVQAQQRIKEYLLSHGMSEAELSEIAYKSNTAKELKITFRINDHDAIVDEMTALIQAGISRDDIYRIYDNRNRIDIKKYKESGGKYADRLKSTGVYNWPINGSITSRFGHRSSPGGVGSTYHQGLDIAGSMGDPIAASDGGTVVFVGWYGGAGKTVMIQHDDGTVTQYSHMSWYDAHEGDIVAQGQTIGKVGSTGNSTGPHLHFAVKVNDKYTDPLPYLNRAS